MRTELVQTELVARVEIRQLKELKVFDALRLSVEVLAEVLTTEVLTAEVLAEVLAEILAEILAELLAELAAGGLGCRSQIWPVVPVV